MYTHTTHTHTHSHTSSLLFSPAVAQCKGKRLLFVHTCMLTYTCTCTHIPTCHTHRRDCVSVTVSSSLVAQGFSILVRQVADLLQGLPLLISSPTPPFVLPLREEDPSVLTEQVWRELGFVWSWLGSVMDSTETQLRTGRQLANAPASGSSSSSSSAQGNAANSGSTSRANNKCKLAVLLCQ